MSEHPDHEQDAPDGARVVAFPQQRARRPDQDHPDQDHAAEQDGAVEQTVQTDADTTGTDRSDDAEPGGPDHDDARSGAGMVDRSGQWSDDEDDDTDESDRAGPVDRADQQAPSQAGQQQDRPLPPILPTWAKDWREFGKQARWQGLRAWYVTRYHTARLPLYAARLARRSPVGSARVLTGLVRWWFDLESDPARMQTVERKDYEAYRRLVLIRSAHRRGRTMILGLAMVPTLVTLVVAWWALGAGLLPWWLPWLTGLVVVLGLGVVGRRADQPVMSPAVVPTHVAKLTAEIVTRALGALGIAEINKAIAKNSVHGIPFPQPIVRDGPGWRAEVDLPYGVTATDIIDRRDRLASGLRRPIGCVWPEPASDEHEGRLVLWVGDRDLSQAPAAAWPLTEKGTTSLFDPVPFGTDQRGRPVEITLMFESMLMGAKPRMGKTFSVRVLALAAALDATAQLHTWELKGSGDLDALERVAHSYGSGIDDDTVGRCLADLRHLYATELPRRTAAIKKQPKDLRPENKVTKQLAQRRSLGLHPLVVFIDECQHLFSHPQYGKEAGELCEKLIKLGPAAGIIVVLSTQRPDAASLPTGVSANAGIRFCLRVMGQVENDMVLGTSMYKNGVRATTFRARDKGIGYLVGVADDPQIVRSAYLDNPTAEKIAARARAARITAGTLTGYAAGDTDQDAQQPTADVLGDLLAVWPEEKDKAWNELLVAGLAELRPGLYGEWTAEQLTTAVKPYGLTTGQVWGTDPDTGKGANRRGLTRDAIQEAVAKRDKTRGGGASDSTD